MQSIRARISIILYRILVKQVKSISLLKWQKFNYGIQNLKKLSLTSRSCHQNQSPTAMFCLESKIFIFYEILNSDTKPQICDIPWPYVEKKNIFDWKEKKLLPGIHRPVGWYVTFIQLVDLFGRPVGTLTPVCGSLTIAKNMQKLLGKINGPKNIRHTPTIAVIGSGGGFRAMTGPVIYEPSTSLGWNSVRGSLIRDGRRDESPSKYWNFGLLYLFCRSFRYWFNDSRKGVKTQNRILPIY